MSENRHVRKNDGDATQINEHLKSKAFDELVDEMADKWDAMDEENFDSRVIDAYLQALEEKAPLTIDTEASLEAFREKHAHLFEQVGSAVSDIKPRARRGRHLRVMRLIAATLAVMLGCMITAQALGFDVFGTIARWTDEIFHFSTPAQTESGHVSSAPAGSEYSNLKEALGAYGITELVAPGWYPSEIFLSSIKVTPTPDSIKFQAAYENGKKFIFITIWQLETPEDANSRIIEKDGQDVVLHESNGIKHYILSNNQQVTAAWTNKNLLCSISGDLSEDEAKKMIDSIYER